MDILSEIFKALGDENRLRIVNLLLKKELCVCELETLLEMTQSNVSRHLTKLKHAGIITSEKCSQWVHYSVHKQFIKKNNLLNDYLSASLTEPVYQSDLARLNRYLQSGYTCEHINKEKSVIAAYLDELP